VKLFARGSFAAAALAVACLLVSIGAAPARAQGSQFSTLYNFQSTNDDAANPIGGLVEYNGDLFGTTSAGGAGTACSGGCGTIFELTPQPGGGYSETILWSFTGGSDGYFPAGDLLVDSSGNLFGTTVDGGTNYSGTIFELTRNSGYPAGYSPNLTTLFAFPGCVEAGGCEPLGGLVEDSSGNLYGTAYAGGAYRNGLVYELPYLSASKLYATDITVLYSFEGNGDGENPTSRLVMYQGNLFGAAAFGGNPTDGAGSVFELTQSTGYRVIAELYQFTYGDSTDGIFPFGDMVADSAGNLYGTTLYEGASGYGTIFEMVNSSGGYSEKTLYSFGANSGDGEHSYGGLAIDSSGNLYGTTIEGGTSTACSSVGGCGTVFELPYNSVSQTYAAAPTTIENFTGGSDGASPAATLLVDSLGNLYGSTGGGGNTGCQGYAASFFSFFPGCGTVFEISTSLPLRYTDVKLGVTGGTQPAFSLKADFDISTGATFDPATQAVTLTVDSYSVSIPAGNFTTLPHGKNAGGWVYSATVNGVSVSMQIDSLGNGAYELRASASPVDLTGEQAPITVTITVGNNTGSTQVDPSF
jgi:uncharacterized repeat protein (TIGR03803 family)